MSQPQNPSGHTRNQSETFSERAWKSTLSRLFRRDPPLRPPVLPEETSSSILVSENPFQVGPRALIVAVLATGLLSLTGIVSFSLVPIAYIALVARFVIPFKRYNTNDSKKIQFYFLSLEGITQFLDWSWSNLQQYVWQTHTRTWGDIRNNLSWISGGNYLSRNQFALRLLRTVLTVGLLAFYPSIALLLSISAAHAVLDSATVLLAQGSSSNKIFKASLRLWDPLIAGLAIYATITVLGLGLPTVLWAPWNVLPTLWSFFSVTANPWLNGVIATVGITAAMTLVNIAWSALIKGTCAVFGVTVYDTTELEKDNEGLIRYVGIMMKNGTEWNISILDPNHRGEDPPLHLSKAEQTFFAPPQQNEIICTAAIVYFNNYYKINRWTHTREEFDVSTMRVDENPNSPKDFIHSMLLQGGITLQQLQTHLESEGHPVELIKQCRLSEVLRECYGHWGKKALQANIEVIPSNASGLGYLPLQSSVDTTTGYVAAHELAATDRQKGRRRRALS